jgi:hypothetical protein
VHAGSKKENQPLGWQESFAEAAPERAISNAQNPIFFSTAGFSISMTHDRRGVSEWQQSQGANCVNQSTTEGLT